MGASVQDVNAQAAGLQIEYLEVEVDENQRTTTARSLRRQRASELRTGSFSRPYHHRFAGVQCCAKSLTQTAKLSMGK